MTPELILMFFLPSVCCFSVTHGINYVYNDTLFENGKAVTTVSGLPICMSYDILVYLKGNKYIVVRIPDMKELFETNFRVKSCSASKRFVGLGNGKSALVYDRLYDYSSLITCADFIKVVGNTVITHCDHEIWLRGMNLVFKVKYKPNDIALIGDKVIVCTYNGLYYLTYNSTQKLNVACERLAYSNGLLAIGSNNKLLIYRFKGWNKLTETSVKGRILKIAIRRSIIYVLSTKGLYAFKLVYIDYDIVNTIVIISALVSLTYLSLKRSL